MLQTIPLLTISLATFVALSLFTGDVGTPWYEHPSLQFQLMSGDLWQVSWGDLFLAFSMVLLFIEILRATRSGTVAVMNHALSVVVFIVALLMFITMRGYGNSVFFLFTSMTLLDFMAGFIITTVTARRDLSVGRVEL
jgi:hypothetical protein